MSPEEILRNFAIVRAARDNLAADNPGQKPLSEADRYWFARAQMNEGPVNKAIGIALPVLAAGEQAGKGVAGLLGQSWGRSGFHPAGILAAGRGVWDGIKDNL